LVKTIIALRAILVKTIIALRAILVKTIIALRAILVLVSFLCIASYGRHAKKRYQSQVLLFKTFLVKKKRSK